MFCFHLSPYPWAPLPLLLRGKCLTQGLMCVDKPFCTWNTLPFPMHFIFLTCFLWGGYNIIKLFLTFFYFFQIFPFTSSCFLSNSCAPFNCYYMNICMYMYNPKNEYSPLSLYNVICAYVFKADHLALETSWRALLLRRLRLQCLSSNQETTIRGAHSMAQRIV